MGKTELSIDGDRFRINGELAYPGRYWRGLRIEGLLMNSRMVQGIFDDKNQETVSRWAYPDTGTWDPYRNTREFVAAMPGWRKKGLLAFTLNLQGGNPRGYSREQPWHHSAYLGDGSLDGEYAARLETILERADELGMVVILGYFYFGQDQRISDERALIRAAVDTTRWLVERGYRNLIIEVNNECDHRKYSHELLRADRVHELIEIVRRESGGLYPVSASFCGGRLPADNVTAASDVILLHGNGVDNPDRIAEMVREVREGGAYRGQPVLFNEDDHFDFDAETNNMLRALENGASWGYFDPGENNYRDGYQSPPTNWGINTPRKRAFFNLVSEITGEGPGQGTSGEYPV